MSAGLLTACIVARDEQAALGGCLASVRGVADAIIVVDHGSQDRTAAIAEQAGARVIDAPGGHHERSRNVYLDAATTPWVLLALDPAFRGRAGAFVVLADAHDRRGDREGALRVAQSALAEDGSASNHLNLAALLVDIDATAARAHFAAALRANPWLLRKEVFGEAATPCIFLQQDALLERVPRGDLLAAQLGHVREEIADAPSLLR